MRELTEEASAGERTGAEPRCAPGGVRGVYEGGA
jgi:hypothetical protein